ncbi:MAG TPA: NTP transferase domain-containing protein [Methanomicrobiales archaeon]|nr:NTP transferase domain-containing protein [Methanomicrobiales archaeon]
MLVLIMAGGRGTRLAMGEKPLVTICGRPMISYVIDAFDSADCEVVVVTSPKTPYTRNWCRVQGITEYPAQGAGYVEDLVEAAQTLEASGPLFTSVSDLPCLTPQIITEIHRRYEESGKPACSTWIPKSLCQEYDCRTAYTEEVQDTLSCPAGINIFLSEGIDGPEEEEKLLIRDPRLAFNINTREERARVEKYLCRERRGE